MRQRTNPTNMGRACGRHLRALGPKRILGRFALGLAATLAISGTGHVMFHPTRTEHDAAVELIAELREGTAAPRSVPTGFVETLGYDPVDAAGLLTDPHGGCSTPGGVGPSQFDRPCRTHDLGYDVLRFAESEGHRLGAWARAEVDLRFFSDLVEACERVTCRVTAAAYYAAVSANSVRQGFKTPTDEPTAPWVMVWLGVFALAVVPRAGFLTDRRIREARVREVFATD